MLRILLLVTAVAAASAPAQAWWFEDDGSSWPVFDFHRYGGDVNRPAATPDRPYFHGDDAVPLGLRWRDLRQAEAEAAADDAAAAAVAASARVDVVLPPPARRIRRRMAVRHHAVRRAPQICVPAHTAARP
ncbi:MAG: hypothetical protein INR64_20525 [Caulobacteraceae bacterium]|nr:hypothetical protein [Caulobacter sp.]